MPESPYLFALYVHIFLSCTGLGTKDVDVFFFSSFSFSGSSNWSSIKKGSARGAGLLRTLSPSLSLWTDDWTDDRTYEKRTPSTRQRMVSCTYIQKCRQTYLKPYLALSFPTKHADAGLHDGTLLHLYCNLTKSCSLRPPRSPPPSCPLSASLFPSPSFTGQLIGTDWMGWSA